MEHGGRPTESAHEKIARQEKTIEKLSAEVLGLKGELATLARIVEETVQAVKPAAEAAAEKAAPLELHLHADCPSGAASIVGGMSRVTWGDAYHLERADNLPTDPSGPG